MLDANIASALKKIIQSSQFKKKVSIGEQKAQKEDRFQWGTQIVFFIYDYFWVAGAHDTVMDFADCSLSLFIMTIFRKFDTRLDEVLCRRCHLMMSWKVFANWENVSLRSSKPYWSCTDMEIHQKLRQRNFWRQKWKNWNWSSGYDSQGSTWCWKRTRRMPSMESKKGQWSRGDMWLPARWR